MYEQINKCKHPIKIWTPILGVESQALNQLCNVANLPIIFKLVAVMPDVHAGEGATIGTVMATKGAICPSVVGVDIGCGMMAVKTNLKKSDIPRENWAIIREAIEKEIPHGRTNNGEKGDKGAWDIAPDDVLKIWRKELEKDLAVILKKHKDAKAYNDLNHLGTLGSGNHFIELTADEEDNVWLMLHSGSRGQGNRFGMYFTRLAKQVCEAKHIPLVDKSLAYFEESDPEFQDYLDAATWAQKFAKLNRDIMMAYMIKALKVFYPNLQTFESVNCHHNYFAVEEHFGEKVYVTRKGAIRAGKDELGIIPGSMGTRSYIVSGLGNEESFCSASHGAGRRMSRTEAKATFTLEQHAEATKDVECKKDFSVIDETPLAYKDIDEVMDNQKDLVKPIAVLKQFICIKG